MATIPKQGPINLADIRDAINAAGGHATNDLMSFFTAANVAEGSPRKPISLGVDFAQDFDSTKPNYSPNFWQDGGKYGWRFDNAKVTGSQSPFLDVYNKYDGDMNGWQRSLPTGGASSPYRLGDFLGYMSDAEPLAGDFKATLVLGSGGSYTEYPNITQIWLDDVVSSTTKLLRFSIETPEEWSDSVELTEITAFDGYYLGVVIMTSYGSVRMRFTGEQLTSSRTSVAMNVTDLGVGTFKIVPFLCDRAVGISDIDSSAMVVYTLPHIKPIQVQILQREPEEGEIEVAANVWMYRENGELRYGWQISAKSTSELTHTFDGGYIYINYTNDMDSSFYQRIELPNITIKKSSTFAEVASGYATVNNTVIYPAGDTLTARIYIADEIPIIEVEVGNRT